MAMGVLFRKKGKKYLCSFARYFSTIQSEAEEQQAAQGENCG
jgi:hypothetical protein